MTTSRSRRRPTAVLLGLLTAVVLAAVAVASPPAAMASRPAGGPASATATCGTALGQTPVVHHVVWVVFENKSLGLFTKASRTSTTPYLTGLSAACGSAKGYSATPYYGAKLAMTSGSSWGSKGDVVQAPGPDLFSQLGEDWTVYMGDMPRACYRENTPTYFARHNPALWYDDARSACAARDLPLPSSPSQLDLSRSFTWVEANVPQSMHGCRLCPANQLKRLQLGDTWASTWVDGILSSPQYLEGDTVVFVVWDQAGVTASIAPFIVVSPWTAPGYVSTASYTHYSLLRVTQDLLGLPPLASAQTPSSMASDFGLPIPTDTSTPTPTTTTTSPTSTPTDTTTTTDTPTTSPSTSTSSDPGTSTTSPDTPTDTPSTTTTTDTTTPTDSPSGTPTGPPTGATRTPGSALSTDPAN